MRDCVVVASWRSGTMSLEMQSAISSSSCVAFTAATQAAFRSASCERHA